MPHLCKSSRDAVAGRNAMPCGNVWLQMKEMDRRRDRKGMRLNETGILTRPDDLGHNVQISLHVLVA